MLIPLLLLGCESSKPQTEESPVDETPINEETLTDDEDCINDADHFSQHVWGSALSPVCFSCHNSQGSAGSSNLVLVSNAQPGYLDTMFRMPRETLMKELRRVAFTELFATQL